MRESQETRETFDAVVVGAGQAGPFLAARLVSAGWKVALVEKRRLGGTCVNDGCTPTKALVASARAAWLAKNAASYGVTISGSVQVDMPAVKARKDAVVKASRDSLQEWMGGLAGLTMIDGHARFTDPHTVAVGTRSLTARRFFLNTGCRAMVPKIPSEVPILTNVEMMEIDALPEHLIVLGGSYVALEFAQMYRRFGSRVTVLERGPGLVPREDPDVAEAVKQILENEGIEVLCNAQASRIEKSPTGGARVQVGDRVIDGSHVLAGTGRAPNADDLGLEAAQVARDAHGYIAVNDELQTSQPHIYALGDVNGRGAFTHTSYNDFEIVAANLLEKGKRRVSDRIPIYGLYIDPPLGRVGMSEREAKAAGKRVLKGVRPMTRVGRASERGETQGFIKILVDADTQLILGAALLGIEGDEAVHTLADTMYCRAPYTTLMHAVHAHPTVSELIPTVLSELKET